MYLFDSPRIPALYSASKVLPEKEGTEEEEVEAIEKREGARHEEEDEGRDDGPGTGGKGAENDGRGVDTRGTGTGREGGGTGGTLGVSGGRREGRLGCGRGGGNGARGGRCCWEGCGGREGVTCGTEKSGGKKDGAREAEEGRGVEGGGGGGGRDGGGTGERIGRKGETPEEEEEEGKGAAGERRGNYPGEQRGIIRKEEKR